MIYNKRWGQYDWLQIDDVGHECGSILKKCPGSLKKKKKNLLHIVQLKIGHVFSH